MNQIDALEDTIDQVVCSPIESLQVDLGKFTNKLDSYCKEAASYLVVDNHSPAEARSALRWLTIVLFGIVVAVTLLLNVGIVIAGATNSQMAICNIGIAVLYALVGMCVMSDLSRGKTHFQDERGRLIERMKRVAEQVRELVRERQHWTTEAAQSKWATDNEKLKLQLAKQQAESIHEKLEDSTAEFQVLMDSIEQKEKAAAELQELIVSHEASKASLTVETRDLEVRIAKSTVTLDELKEQQLRVQCELNTLSESLRLQQDEHEKLEHLKSAIASLESTLESETVKLAEIEKECQVATIERERIQEDSLTLLATVSENETKLSQIQESMSFLNLEMSEKTLAGEALSAKLSDEQRAMELAIADADRARERILAEVSQGTAEYEALKEKMTTSQQTYLEIINQTVELECQLTHRQESIILAEANLRSLDASLVAKQTQLDSLENESIGTEQRTALLLTQLAELECLSAVKLATEESEKLAVETHLKEAAEFEKAQLAELESMRLELDTIRSELDTRQILIEESFQNSHKISREAEKSLSDATRRVEMLSEKADSLAKQVEAKSTELFGHKQELIAIRAEIRELEAAKVAVAAGAEELAAMESQIESRHCELAELEEQLAESRRALTNKQEDIGQLDMQCNTIHAALVSMNVEFADRSLSFNQLQEHSTQLANECQQMDATKTSLTAQVDVAKNELLDIQDRIQEQQTNHASLMAEHRSLSQEYERLVESNRMLLERNEEAELEAERLLQLKSYSEELEVQIASSNRQIDQLADEHDALLNAIKGQSETLESCTIRTKEIQSELPEWELKLATVQVRQSDLEQELCEMMASLDNARSERTEIESEERTAKSRIEKLNHRASEIEHECTSSVAKLQQLSDEVAEAQGIVQQWTDYMATLQSDQQAKETTIQTLESRISQLQIQESAASDAFESSKEKLEATRLALHDIQAEQQSLELELKRSQLELETSIQQREMESDRKAQIQFAIADMESQSSTIEEQINVENEMLSTTRAIQVAQQKLDDTKSAIRDASRKLDDINALKLESENELNASRQESQILVGEQEQKKLEIQATEALRAKVNATLQELQTEKLKLIPEVNALKEKCDELEIERKNAIEVINILKLETEELASLSQAMAAKVQENEASAVLSKNLTVLENNSLSYFDSVEEIAVENDQKSLSFPSALSIEEEILVSVSNLKNVVPPPRGIGGAKIDAWDMVFSGSANG